MRIIFFGTPEFAVPILKSLIASEHSVVGVVTQPDRPQGRGLRLKPSPIKETASALSIPVYQPERPKDIVGQIQAATPDLIWVTAYGKMIPESILKIPSHGCMNVHPSLLPKYRGAAPIPWAILNGETTTGISIHTTVKEMDAGDILYVRTYPIDPKDTTQTLSQKLASLGAECVLKVMNDLKKRALHPIPQDHSKATFAPMLKRSDGQIDWKRSAIEIHHQVRAFTPWPLAYTELNEEFFNIIEAEVKETNEKHSPGSIIKCSKEGIEVATGHELLSILKLQPPNKKPMAARDFLNGYRGLLTHFN